MNTVRKLVLLVGILLSGVTILFATTPAFASAIPVSSIVSSLGGDWVFVAVFGGLAVVFILVTMAWRAVNGLDQTEPPSPEDVQTVPLFGSDFDDVVEKRAGLGDRFLSDKPAAVRQRVREAAIAAEMRTESCSRSEAERRVADGSWTDDATAAAFLSDEDGPSPPLSARVGAMVRGRAWFQRGARRAAAVIVGRVDEVGQR